MRLPVRARAQAVRDDVLQPYLEELRGHRLLDRERELALAREIERLEVGVWTALLSRSGAPAVVAAAVSTHLRPRAPALAALAKLARSEHVTRGDARRAAP